MCGAINLPRSLNKSYEEIFAIQQGKRVVFYLCSCILDIIIAQMFDSTIRDTFINVRNTSPWSSSEGFPADVSHGELFSMYQSSSWFISLPLCPSVLFCILCTRIDPIAQRQHLILDKLWGPLINIYCILLNIQINYFSSYYSEKIGNSHKQLIRQSLSKGKWNASLFIYIHK